MSQLCPKCGSGATSLKKKTTGVGWAVASAAVIGGIFIFWPLFLMVIPAAFLNAQHQRCQICGTTWPA